MISGRVFTFWTLIVLFGVFLYTLKRGREGYKPWIRRIAGLDAIDEAVGRATEMGRPVFCTPGVGDVTTADALQSVAGIEVVSHVARLTAKYGTGLITTASQANVYAIIDGAVRQAYLEAGKLDQWKPEMVRFMSSEQWAFAGGCLGIFNREKIGAAIMIGFFQAESLMLAEGSVQAGAVSVGGTARLQQLPVFVAACDYCLIGEEIFVAGAYLSDDPIRKVTVWMQDIGKLIGLALLLIGTIMVLIGDRTLPTLMKQ